MNSQISIYCLVLLSAVKAFGSSAQWEFSYSHIQPFGLAHFIVDQSEASFSGILIAEKTIGQSYACSFIRGDDSMLFQGKNSAVCRQVYEARNDLYHRGCVLNLTFQEAEIVAAGSDCELNNNNR